MTEKLFAYVTKVASYKAIIRVAHIADRSNFSQIIVATLLLPFSGLSFISYVYIFSQRSGFFVDFPLFCFLSRFSLILFWNVRLSKVTASGMATTLSSYFFVYLAKGLVFKYLT